jgi:hypothetical protein
MAKLAQELNCTFFLVVLRGIHYRLGQIGAFPASALTITAIRKMPSEEDLKNFLRLQQGVPFDTSLKLVAELPPFPEDVRKRFPSMAQYEASLKDWHSKLILALQGGGPATISTEKPAP